MNLPAAIIALSAALWAIVLAAIVAASVWTLYGASQLLPGLLWLLVESWL